MSVRTTTRLGTVIGSERDGLRIFRGVPFAAPPLGALRFEAPQPPLPWREPLVAQAFGPGPLQPEDGLSKSLGLLDGREDFDEDCLHLNLWCPAEPAPPRPVMVWLHGGAFQSGTAAGPAYDGARLARRGDVVVVTLNYRVGALGFLHLDEAGPSNLGLQDQIAALRFVRDEIGAFGGDPENVTLFGESAGAGSLCALLAMPAAHGLFRRAIIQSAAPNGILSDEEGLARAQIFLDELGLEKADLATLRALPPERILEAQAACREPGPRRIGMFFAPVVEGRSLPLAPLAAVAQGTAAGVELIIGTTAEEMRLYAMIPGFGELDEAQLRQSVAERLPSGVQGRAQALLAAYPAASSPRDRFFALETDWHLWLPATRMAEAQAAHQPKTFMYRFTWRSNFKEGICRACHALDVPFTLGNLDANPPLAAFSGSGPMARALSDLVMDAWAGFARSGDPSPPGAPAWPSYTLPRRATYELGAHPRVLEAPDEVRRVAWAQAIQETP